MTSQTSGPRALVAAARACLTISTLACANAACLAQTAVKSATVVITAARAEQSLPDALPSTRVITRTEIDALQPVDLPGLLRALTSIDVAQAGPLGSQTSVFMRGADSRQTLVLIDGVPLQRADFGSASWQNLPVDQVERVEIVRGNLSSLYGAQAVGGVVHIITRRAHAPQASVSLGSQGSRAAAASGGTAWGGDGATTRVSAALSTRTTAGYSARDAAVDPGANPDLDPSSQTAGSAQLEQTWAPGHRTRLSLMAARTRSAYDGFARGLDDVLVTRTQAAGFSSRHALSANLTLTAEVGQTRERFDDPTGFSPRGDNRVQLSGAQLAWQASASQQWQVGSEVKRERFTDSTAQLQTRSTRSLRMAWLGSFGGDGHAPAKLQLQAHLRGDHSDAFGSATTGLLALAYTLQPGLKASVQWSSGFSAPSFLDEQFANAATVLRAERSRQGEVALHWSGAHGAQLRAALFAQRQRDRLSFDPATFETVNIARARNRGVELMADWPLGPGRVGVDATFQNPVDADTGQAQKRRARETLALNYNVNLASWQAVATLRHSGQRLDTDPVNFADAINSARTTLGLALHRQLSPTWRASVKLDNLGAAGSAEVLGYTPAPRSVAVTLIATPQ